MDSFIKKEAEASIRLDGDTHTVGPEVCACGVVHMVSILGGNATIERRKKSREQARRYYAEHRDAIKAKHAAYRESHRVERRTYERERYYREPERVAMLEMQESALAHLEIKASGMRSRYKTPFLRLISAVRKERQRIAELEAACAQYREALNTAKNWLDSIRDGLSIPEDRASLTDVILFIIEARSSPNPGEAILARLAAADALYEQAKIILGGTELRVSLDIPLYTAMKEYEKATQGTRAGEEPK